MATLVVEKEVRCSPALAVNRIYRALGAEGMHETTHVLHAPFEDLGLPNIGELSREVTVTLGDPERKRTLTRIPLSWRVPANGNFPVFRGFFEVQPLSSRDIQLSLLGYYHAPYGVIGAVFDAVLGHKIAEVTTRYLVDEVCRAIEEPTANTAAQLG
jgi:hypothetical protein